MLVMQPAVVLGTRTLDFEKFLLPDPEHCEHALYFPLSQMGLLPFLYS